MGKILALVVLVLVFLKFFFILLIKIIFILHYFMPCITHKFSGFVTFTQALIILSMTSLQGM